jgi:hypothetical protein
MQRFFEENYRKNFSLKFIHINNVTYLLVDRSKLKIKIMVKILSQILFLCLFLLFVQCAGEQTTGGEEMTEESIQESTETLMPKLDIDTMTISAEEKAAIMQGEAERKAAIEEGIKKSILKEKTCEEIFGEYKEIAEQYLSTKDDKILLKLSAWTNDPIYMSCRKKGAFKAQFEELRKKVDAVGEEDEDDLF